MAKIKLQYTRLVEEVIEIPDDKFEALNRRMKDPYMSFEEWEAIADYMDEVWEDTAERVGDDFCDKSGVYTLDNHVIAEY